MYSSREVVIVDYGIGNLKSVEQAVKKCNAIPIITSDKEILLKAKKIIFPGVGAFPRAVKKIIDLKLQHTLYELYSKNISILGICLGMQLFFEYSEEFGHHCGLGFIKGKVMHIKSEYKTKIILPHIGWNNLILDQLETKNTLLEGINNKDRFYFVHSFHAICTDDEALVINTQYIDKNICAFVKKNNLVGCQFHPEKSGNSGLILMKAWIDG